MGFESPANTNERTQKSDRMMQEKARAAKGFKSVFEQRLAQNVQADKHLTMSAIYRALSPNSYSGHGDGVRDVAEQLDEIATYNETHFQGNDYSYIRNMAEQFRGIEEGLEAERQSESVAHGDYNPERALQKVKDLLAVLNSSNI